MPQGHEGHAVHAGRLDFFKAWAARKGREALPRAHASGWLDVFKSWAVEPPPGLTRPILIPNSTNARASLTFVPNFEEFNVAATVALFSTLCIGRRHGVFLDSGAHEGAWSMLAASMGCHAIAVDPGPACVRRLHAAARKNEVDHLVHVTNALLAPSPYSVDVDARSCGAQSQFPASSRASEARAPNTVRVPSVRVDALVPRGVRVHLWHLDVEGAEVGALRSAAALFDANLVDRILVEWLPYRWPTYNVSVEEGRAEARSRFAGWHCVIACNGEEHRPDDNPESRPPCRAELASLGVRPADLYCTAPWLPWYEDPGMQVFVDPTRVQAARAAAAAEAGCAASPAAPALAAPARVALLSSTGPVDTPRYCEVFLSHYRSQGIAARDIVITGHGEAPAVRECFERGGASFRTFEGGKYFSQNASQHARAALQVELLATYSHVVQVDLDELVVARPDKYASLAAYAEAAGDRPVVAARGYEGQPTADGGVVWATHCGESKAVLARVPTEYSGGYHVLVSPVLIAPCDGHNAACVDPDLALLHVKCAYGVNATMEGESEWRERDRHSHRCDGFDRFLRSGGRERGHSTFGHVGWPGRVPEWVREAGERAMRAVNAG